MSYHLAHGLTRRTRNTKTLFFSHAHNSTNMEATDPILAALESLRLGEYSTIKETADRFGVERSTLSKRHRGVQGSRATQAEKSRNLDTTQEKQLIKYISRLC